MYHDPAVLDALHDAIDEARRGHPGAAAAAPAAAVHIDPARAKALLSWFLQNLPGLLSIFQGQAPRP